MSYRCRCSKENLSVPQHGLPVKAEVKHLVCTLFNDHSVTELYLLNLRGESIYRIYNIVNVFKYTHPYKQES